MPRKTDSNNPADWLFIAESDLAGLRILARLETGYEMCRSKLAEVLEKVLKAELIRTGWLLEKTHDLLKLYGELEAGGSDLAPHAQSLCVSRWHRSISTLAIRVLIWRMQTGRISAGNCSKSANCSKSSKRKSLRGPAKAERDR
ncbi:MAG: HEPN domain-containing protein [Verrucomicrobiota bacterium]